MQIELWHDPPFDYPSHDWLASSVLPHDTEPVSMGPWLLDNNRCFPVSCDLRSYILFILSLA